MGKENLDVFEETVKIIDLDSREKLVGSDEGGDTSK